MNKFLTAAVLALTIASVNIAAQNYKILQPGVKIDRNQVNYAETKAFSDGRGVWLGWTTSLESRNLGFYVYRIVGGDKELVSTSMIPGAYMRMREEKISSGSYSFFDPDGSPDSSYVIENYNVSGQRRFSGIIATKFVKDLADVTGTSSEEFASQSRNATPSISGSDSMLPEDLAVEVANLTLPPNPIRQLWVAGQPGVRLGIKEEGFYRVSRAALQTAGFDVNAPVARWQLYVNGVEQAINVGDSGDYIEFYGKGTDTPYADTQIYYLVVGTENGKRIGTTTRRRITGSVISNSYSQFFFKKSRSIYFSSLLNGDTENFYGNPIYSTTSGSLDFNLSGIDFNAPTASIEVKTVGITLVNHQTRVVLNDVEIGTYSNSNYDPATGVFTFSTSLLREGANRLKLTAFGDTSDTSTFDSLKVNFARRYLANQNRLAFYVPNYKISYAEGFTTQNVRVFDMTNSDTPVLITGMAVEPSNGGFRVNIPSNRSRVMYAVENSGLLSPVSMTANTPSSLSTVAHNADFVIISHKNFLARANEWAEYRRAQGMLTEVVDIEDVYDEFNFGAVSADCIRSFLNYAKTNWQTAPRYVMLIGDATYDPKNYLGVGGNFVPTRLVDTIYSEVGSDDTLADFNNDGLAELAIGRIPAKVEADVTLALNKIKLFEQSAAQASSRGTLFASDLPDGYDFEGLSSRLCDQLPSSYNCVKINRGQPNAGANLLTAMNQGKYLVNYSGHGNAAVWATSSFFGTSQASQLNNANLSIFTMLTCLNGYFIDPYSNSLSEILLKNPNGGAAVAWSSSGLTTPDIQEVMATRFYNQIGFGSINRMGDLVNDAKTTINFGRDVRLSWVLLGDPTMKVR